MEQPALLEMRGISKEFPGVKALDNVNLTVRAGTVHALMGENGAGKSTLMKCLFGIYNKDGGPSAWNPVGIFLTLAGFVALRKWKLSPVLVMVLCGVANLLWGLAV